MSISPITFSPFSSNLTALSRLETQTQQIAQTVASTGAGTHDESASPRDPEEGLVRLKGVALSFEANVRTIARADELVGTLLDIVR